MYINWTCRYWFWYLFYIMQFSLHPTIYNVYLMLRHWKSVDLDDAEQDSNEQMNILPRKRVLETSITCIGVLFALFCRKILKFKIGSRKHNIFFHPFSAHAWVFAQNQCSANTCWIKNMRSCSLELRKVFLCECRTGRWQYRLDCFVLVLIF